MRIWFFDIFLNGLKKPVVFLVVIPEGEISSMAPVQKAQEFGVLKKSTRYF